MPLRSSILSRVKALSRRLKALTSRRKKKVHNLPPIPLLPMLPPEIWYHVLTFLTNSELRRVCTVNHIFLDAFLGTEHESLVLEMSGRRHYDNTRRLEKLNGHFANRVRTIYCLDHLDDRGGFGSIRPLDYSHITIPTEAARSLFNALYLTFGIFTDFQILFEVLPEKLTHFPRLDAFLLDGSTTIFPSLTSFTPVWAHIGKQLRSLTLSGHSANFAAFFDSDPHLPLLTDLSLFIQSYSNQADILRVFDRFITPFVQRHANQLVALDLLIWLFADLSSLFSFGPFPHMRKFRLTTPFHVTLVQNPSHLESFFERNQTIRDVYLDLSPHQSHRIPSRTESAPLAKWMCCWKTDRSFSNLTTLAVYPPRQAFSTFVGILRRSVSTLEELRVLTLLMDSEELKQVVLALETGRLRRLQVTVEDINANNLLTCTSIPLEKLTFIFGGLKQMEHYSPSLFSECVVHHLEIGSLFGKSVLNDFNTHLCRSLFPYTIVTTLVSPDSSYVQQQG